MKTKNKTLRFRECDVGDSMNVKKVLNLYRNVSEVKPNQSRMGKNSMDEICSFGDSACLHPAAAYNLNSLKDDDRKSIIEDMSDWEVYMFCKENEERKRVRYERTSVPIRNQNCSNTVIKVKSHQNNAADVSFFQVDKQEEDRTESPQNTRKEMSRADEAILEKILGNKCFEKGEYEAACQHYTNSLNLSFNLIDSYNNRAMCYIKLENYSAAFQDINEVLKRERGNEKALYRKVLSLKGMRMYEEALEEIRNYKSSNKRYLKVSMEIKDEISKLNGKKYNIRRRDGKKKKFQIDVSQLPVYANCDQSYLLEVDRMGCMRHCVCEYCTEEDQLNRSKSDSLRIRERARWKLLDYQLLKTIGVVKEQTNDFAANAVSNDYMLSEKPRNHKNETINGMTSAKSTNKTAVENVRPVHLNYASNDNFLKRKKETESHHRVDNNSSRNHDDDDSNAALLDDFSLTEIQSVNDLDTNKILKWTTYLKNTNAAILKKDFDITLSVDHLTIILKIIKTSFHLEKEWNKICDVLNAVSSIQQFPLVIKSVDENAKQDLRSLLHDAVVLKLENATIIEEKYFGSFSEV